MRPRPWNRQWCAHIAVQKYVMYSTLYRLEREYERQGLKLSQQTMSNWLLRASDLSAEAARGIEQIEMLYYHTLNTSNKINNQINGISPNNKNLLKYMEAGRGALKYTENQISNEILYWTGQ